MAMRSKETIINAALLKCGHTSSDVNTVGVAIEANYDEIVRAAFEDAGGSLDFGRARTTLTSRSDGDFGYDDAYTFATDVIQIFEVYLNERAASDLQEPWEVDATVPALMVNASGRTVEIEYLREGQEHTWSANFALGVQRGIEAVIKSVIEETEEAAYAEQQADSFLFKASVKGSKNRSPRPIFKRGGGRIMRARNNPYNGGR